MKISSFTLTNKNFEGLVSIVNYDNNFEGESATLFFNLGILEIKKGSLYTAKIIINGPNNKKYVSNNFIIDGNSVTPENKINKNLSAGIYNLSTEILLHPGLYEARIILTNYESEVSNEEYVNLSARTYFYAKRNILPPHLMFKNPKNVNSQAPNRTGRK